MKTNLDEIAGQANKAVFDATAPDTYIDGAPHIKHASLNLLYDKLVKDVYVTATQRIDSPKVLDLGAGEGSATLPFLKLGADVTAVEISENRVRSLKQKCLSHAQNLTVHTLPAVEALDVLKAKEYTCDIIVTSAFLHHCPDYVELVKRATELLRPHGQFLSFEDPLRFDTIGLFTKAFSFIAYVSWRIFKEDVVGGIKRRIRRSKGLHLEQCVEDYADYHGSRNGVDQDALYALFCEKNMDCEVFKYFSTQSRFWQPIGMGLHLKNTFALIAKKTQ